MVEPEAAFMGFEEMLRLEERMVCYIVEHILNNCEHLLREIGRDVERLKEITPPFPRLTYTEAVDLLRRKGMDISWGDDFGAPHEAAIASEYTTPVFVAHFPTQIKAFYMQPDPDNPDTVLGRIFWHLKDMGRLSGRRKDTRLHAVA